MFIEARMEATSEPSKLLEKGPEYLRKQMELEGETKGRVSAVELLAASKPKYVKSQQVVNSTQEPALSLGSASVSSTGSSNRSSGRGKTGTIGVAGGGGGTSPGQVRRSSSKKRPDSLLIHRQKCELMRGSRLNRKHHVARKRLERVSVSKKVPLVKVSDADGDGEEVCSSATPVKAAAQLLTVPECERRPGRGVGRSHSDISSRYSRNFADFDAFFKFCGLDAQVVDALGRDNFSARSGATGAEEEEGEEENEDEGGEDDKFSRSSGDSDGLLEEELHGSIRQSTSVIERNARIIKWLYSCKNAKETGKKLRDLD